MNSRVKRPGGFHFHIDGQGRPPLTWPCKLDPNVSLYLGVSSLSQVLWYRDESVMVPSDTRILESSGNKYTLILRSVEESDFGLYSCTADNLLGRSSQNIELSGRPSRAIFLSESTGFSADSFNLTWKIDSYAPIEEYKLMFRKLYVSVFFLCVSCRIDP